MSVKRLGVGALAVAIGLLGAVIPATALAAGSSYWNVAGTYGVNVEYLSVNYPETLILTQSGTGTITGASIDAGVPGSFFTITSGLVVGDAITINGNNGTLTLLMTGSVGVDGSMSGHWGTTPDGRTGTWATTSGAAQSVATSTHEKSDLVTQITPGNNGPAVGAVIFNSSAGSPNNLEMTLQLKKVTPNTSYDVYLFLDTWANGAGVVVGTLTTNGVGNGTFHVNTMVTPGIHSVAVDVTLHGSLSDLYVTSGLYGLNLFMFFQ